MTNETNARENSPRLLAHYALKVGTCMPSLEISTKNRRTLQGGLRKDCDLSLLGRRIASSDMRLHHTSNAILHSLPPSTRGRVAGYKHLSESLPHLKHGPPRLQNTSNHFDATSKPTDAINKIACRDCGVPAKRPVSPRFSTVTKIIGPASTTPGYEHILLLTGQMQTAVVSRANC